MPIRIVIVEDDLRFLEGICLLLEGSPSIDVVGRFTKGGEAIEGILEKCPDVALIDLGLPDISGVEVIRRIKERGLKTEFLVLTIYDDDGHLFQAIRAGAVDYIIKSEASLSEVIRVIEEVIKGWARIPMGIARRILAELKESPRGEMRPGHGLLTKREQEVLQLLVKGYNAKKIADILSIGYEAVRKNQKNIYSKLHVNSAIEAVALFKGYRGL